ncbi:RNA-directed DNA polymerase, eukaryota, reverse transcriptase zinc-binding domain protein [Tanacetum coccineum]
MSKAYKKISNLWGTFLFSDEDTDVSLSNGRVCIKTHFLLCIKDQVLVEIEKDQYSVFVKEILEWTPIIKKPFEEKDEDNSEKEENDEVNSRFEENSIEGNNALDVENIATVLEEPDIQSSPFDNGEIKEWNVAFRKKKSKDQQVIQKGLLEIEKLVDDGHGSQIITEERNSLLSRIRDIDRLVLQDKKRRQLAIKGIRQNGDWVTHPQSVKNAFFEFYQSKFDRFTGGNIHSRSQRFKALSPFQIEVLDCDLTRDEVKEAVWACGSDKAPGPDGFTFSFLKRFWDILQDDVYGYIDEFFHSSNIPIGCNSSFITLIPKIANPVDIKDYRSITLIGLKYKILSKLLANRLAKVLDSIISFEQTAFIKGRQILDGPMILKRTVEWFKEKKKKLLLFKVDFDKAFNSLSWDYLQKITEYLGFSQLWSDRIHACLTSSRSSILVNRSPTNEFHIKRGLRQGDPLSPFLFIIDMEGLHVAIEDALAAGLYRGLQINLQKSNILSIGVSAEIISQFDLLTGCTSASLPFSYLGIPVGASMSRFSGLKTIINRFKKKLSTWKIKFLSIGGRSMLIKFVFGSLGEDNNDKKMHWVKWNSVLSSKENGGLDIGSLEAFNKALLYKWKWRLCRDPNALWVKIIKSVHG